MFCGVESHWKKIKMKFENLQKTFTRLVFCRLHQGVSQRNLPRCGERLKLFGLRSLQYRRTVSDIVFCFKLLRGELKLRTSKHWIFRPFGLRTVGLVYTTKESRITHKYLISFSIEGQDGLDTYQVRFWTRRTVEFSRNVWMNSTFCRPCESPQILALETRKRWDILIISSFACNCLSLIMFIAIYRVWWFKFPNYKAPIKLNNFSQVFFCYFLPLTWFILSRFTFCFYRPSGTLW